MNDKKNVYQEEIDKLGISIKTTVFEDVKNIIILFKNELNVLEKEIESLPDDIQKKVRRKLNGILDYIINIRRKG